MNLCDTQETAPDDIELVSQLLLEIYRLAREESLGRFPEAVFECLAPILGFNAAWWGRSTLTEEGPWPHLSHLFGLPDSYIDDWKRIRREDITAERVFSDPGQAVIVDMIGADAPAGLHDLGLNYGLGEVLCIVSTDSVTGLNDHLSLYRHPGDAGFSERDRRLLECLLPHLVSAASTNQIRSLHALRESLSEQRMAFAVSDSTGMLQSTEPGFVDLILLEIPSWQGPQLPSEVTPDGYQGEQLTLESLQIGELLLLVARPRCAIEQLSARETDVARLFGDGRTYKAIAQDLGMSPNTVRHHIRSIYAKLGVNSKADIAHLLHQLPSFNNDP